MEKKGVKKPLLCRLCSAKRNLISLFKSSDFIYRCNIKKLIAQAVSIQYEKGDGLKYVCCSCVIQSYNCYVFKVKCLENEQKLKNSFSHLKENNLPSLEVLRESVVWLYNKSLGENDSELSSPASSKEKAPKVNGSVKTYTSNESVNTKVSTPVMVDESVQTVPPKTFNVGVSAYHPAISYIKDDKSTQTKPVSIKNVSVSCSLSNCDISIEKPAQLKQGEDKDTFKSPQNKESLFDDNISQSNENESSLELEQAVASNRKRKHKTTNNNNTANKLFKTDCHKNNATEKSSDDVTGNLEIEINEEISMESLDIKSEPLSPAAVTSCSSFAPVENSLQFTKKVEYLRNCKECGILLHTKDDSREHRKTHMKCYLCKKRFRSIKKAKEHMNSSCIRNICSKEPVISIEKMREKWI